MSLSISPHVILIYFLIAHSELNMQWTTKDKHPVHLSTLLIKYICINSDGFYQQIMLYILKLNIIFQYLLSFRVYISYQVF